MNYRFTLRSENRKTGPIPVTMSPQSSCPSTCPLKGEGCYAETGPMSIAWRKLDGSSEGVTWEQMLAGIKSLPEGQVWRHNTAGDLPHSRGRVLAKELGQLVQANLGKRGFTYTHHMLTDDNVRWLRAANDYGFTVNASNETLEGVDAAMDAGLPAVVVLPSTTTENVVTPKGRRVVLCPAVTHDNVTCESCRLCANSKREVAIGFPAHGGRRRVIDIKLQKEATHAA